jgi:predicted PurR-regulated permease PerM
MSFTRPAQLPAGESGKIAAEAPAPVELAIVGFVIVVTLYFGQAVLVPLALAVILSFILAPAVRALRHWGLPNSAAVLVVVLLASAIIFGAGGLIAQQVTSLAREIPGYQLTLRDKVKVLKDATAGSGGALERASETLKDLQKELEKPEPGVGAPSPFGGVPQLGTSSQLVPVEVHQPRPTPLDQLQSIIGVILAPLATAGITLLFVIFLLMQRLDVRDRAIRLIGARDLEKTTVAMDDAGQRLSRYFLAMTAINAGYGIFMGLALWMIGIPSPLLWGVLAMLMRFVPFVGSFIAAAFPVLLAAAVDPGWSTFFVTLALYVVGELIMGNAVEPIVQGNRTGLSPLAIVLSAAFWTLLWGPIGLLLAIPLTVVLVVLGRHVERLEFLHVLLGDTPPLSPAEQFYQRMLAGDPAEPIEQAERFIEKRPLVTYYDEVLLEGLRLAQGAANRGTLEPDQLPDIRETAEVLIDSLADFPMMSRKATRRAAAAAEEEAEAEGEDTRDLIAGDDDEREAEDEGSAIYNTIDPETLAPQWRTDRAVLCVANRTALDESVALVLAQLLEKCGIGARVLGPDKVRHGALAPEYLEGVQLICISALDVNERSAHVRLMARRLKRSAPDATLVGGFWKLDPDEPRGKEILETVTVDHIVQTLDEALCYCIACATGKKDAADEGEAPSSKATVSKRTASSTAEVIPLPP